MEKARRITTKALLRFEQSIQQLVDLDAGAHMDDEDKPLRVFGSILNAAARQPIETDTQLRILRKEIDYLMAEAGAPHRSIEEAMEVALQEAIDTAPDALQGALLALLRQQMRVHRIDPLNA